MFATIAYVLWFLVKFREVNVGCVCMGVHRNKHLFPQDSRAARGLQTRLKKITRFKKFKTSDIYIKYPGDYLRYKFYKFLTKHSIVTKQMLKKPDSGKQFCTGKKLPQSIN